jgi:hypothetical protein
MNCELGTTWKKAVLPVSGLSGRTEENIEAPSGEPAYSPKFEPRTAVYKTGSPAEMFNVSVFLVNCQ